MNELPSNTQICDQMQDMSKFVQNNNVNNINNNMYNNMNNNMNINDANLNKNNNNINNNFNNNINNIIGNNMNNYQFNNNNNQNNQIPNYYLNPFQNQNQQNMNLINRNNQIFNNNYINNNNNININNINYRIINCGNKFNSDEINIIITSSYEEFIRRKDPLSKCIIQRIKNILGGNWVVFVCAEGLKGYDLSVSVDDANRLISFIIANFKFQIIKISD